MKFIKRVVTQVCAFCGKVVSWFKPKKNVKPKIIVHK